MTNGGILLLAVLITAVVLSFISFRFAVIALLLIIMIHLVEIRDALHGPRYVDVTTEYTQQQWRAAHPDP